MSETLERPRPMLGWAGFALGAGALMLALVAFWAGPFAPQQTASVTLGEMAAEIGKSAMRSVAGMDQPAPQHVTRDLDDWLQVAVAALGGLAVVLAAAALIRREDMRPAVAAVALGGGAVMFQLFTWMVLAVIGCLIVMALLASLSDVFGGILGG